MHQKKQQVQSLIFSGQQFNCQDYQAENENKNADPVDAMHIANPFGLGPVWIFFPQVEVFRDLF